MRSCLSARRLHCIADSSSLFIEFPLGRRERFAACASSANKARFLFAPFFRVPRHIQQPFREHFIHELFCLHASQITLRALLKTAFATSTKKCIPTGTKRKKVPRNVSMRKLRG
jgi:hypothetical protein